MEKRNKNETDFILNTNRIRSAEISESKGKFRFLEQCFVLHSLLEHRSIGRILRSLL